MALSQWINGDLFSVLRDKINAIVDFCNNLSSPTATTIPLVPVGAIMPWWGNPGDTTIWDIDGVGKPNTPMANFALCLGQGLTGSLLKNFDGSARSITPDLKGRFPVGWDSASSEFTQIGSSGGSKTHKHVWSERGTSTNKTRNASGVLKDWLFLTEQRQTGDQSTAAAPPAYGTDFPDGKTYTDTQNHLNPYITTGFIIRYK